jgi:predicted ATPase/class 3 adenylate cyclase
MPELPSGTVTFLFTDIEGSTALWERDRVAMAAAVERHLAILREAGAAHGGVLFKTVGDAVQVAFPVAPDALAAAVAAQQSLLTEPWPNPPGPLPVRMALHVGQAEPREGDYVSAPLNRLARLLMSAHGGQILLSQAVQQLVRDDLPADVVLLDLGSHRLRDLQEPEEIFQVVAPGLSDAFPPIHTLPSHPTNVPVPPTALIGREAEVATVLHWIKAGARLITLTGPGGTGKTRLAVEIAAEALEHHPEGAFFVDLAPIRDPALVVPTIATVLGVRDTSGEQLRESLARYLSDRQMLLVLDNFEQVLGAAGDVSALIAASPRLTVLVTSREPLRVRAERTFPVSPLQLPASEGIIDFAVLSQMPSIALFVERAQAADPVFVLTESNGPAVAAICRRLDGLPLAIELAAARVRLLPPEALLGRLERSLPLLTTGARDAPARQRTLRDTIAWSHDLLSPEEQALFRQLSAFVGGWTVEAAEAVASPGGDQDVLGGMGNLIERSLVQRGQGAEEDPRFTMLETIREYGLEQLAVSGEEMLTRERHAAWILDLAEHAEPELFRADQQRWWSRLEAERPNIRAALRWYERIGDAERAQRLAGALWTFAWLRGHFQEGEDWLRRALAIPVEPSGATRAWVMVGQEALAWNRSDFASAWTLGEAALAASREAAFPRGVAVSLGLLAGTALMQDDLERALMINEEAIAHLRAAGHPGWLGVFLVDMGLMNWLNGDDEQGKSYSAEGLALNRSLGNRWIIANHVNDLGVVAHGRGELVEAARHYAESVRLFRDVGDTWFIASPLAGLAAIAVAHGRAETAARLLGVAAAVREASGAVAWTIEQGRDEQTVSTARAVLGVERFAQVLADGRALTLQHAIDEALVIAADRACAEDLRRRD